MGIRSSSGELHLTTSWTFPWIYHGYVVMMLSTWQGRDDYRSPSVLCSRMEKGDESVHVDHLSQRSRLETDFLAVLLTCCWLSRYIKENKQPLNGDTKLHSWQPISDTLISQLGHFGDGCLLWFGRPLSGWITSERLSHHSPYLPLRIQTRYLQQLVMQMYGVRLFNRSTWKVI